MGLATDKASDDNRAVWRDRDKRRKTGRRNGTGPTHGSPAYYRLKRYGLTEERYQKMLQDQDGKCAICTEEMTKVCVDHCHDSREVRGLLCDACNVGLGRFKDDEAVLERALAYIRRCNPLHFA